jgi:hypothetical protein
MATILKKAISLLTGAGIDPSTDLSVSKNDLKKRPLKSLSERDLIRLESEIGAELFGPIPAGHDRSFFNLDEHTWIWFEQWKDANSGKTRSATTRYEVQDNGILKIQEGARYNFLEGQELANFMVAIRMYYERVMREVYNRDPASGEKLS